MIVVPDVLDDVEIVDLTRNSRRVKPSSDEILLSCADVKSIVEHSYEVARVDQLTRVP